MRLATPHVQGRQADCQAHPVQEPDDSDSKIAVLLHGAEDEDEEEEEEEEEEQDEAAEEEEEEADEPPPPAKVPCKAKKGKGKTAPEA